MSSRSTTQTIRLGRFVGIGVVLLGSVAGGARWAALARAGSDDDLGAAGRAARPAPLAVEERLKADVTYLAADARDGRAPGTPGIEAAADYIADVFKEAGLKPAPGADGYFQPFSISGRPTLGTPQELALDRPRRKGAQGRAQDRLQLRCRSASAATLDQGARSSSPATASRPRTDLASSITTTTPGSTSRERPS